MHAWCDLRLSGDVIYIARNYRSQRDGMDDRKELTCVNSLLDRDALWTSSLSAPPSGHDLKRVDDTMWFWLREGCLTPSNLFTFGFAFRPLIGLISSSLPSGKLPVNRFPVSLYPLLFIPFHYTAGHFLFTHTHTHTYIYIYIFAEVKLLDLVFKRHQQWPRLTTVWHTHAMHSSNPNICKRMYGPDITVTVGCFLYKGNRITITIWYNIVRNNT